MGKLVEQIALEDTSLISSKSVDGEIEGEEDDPEPKHKFDMSMESDLEVEHDDIKHPNNIHGQKEINLLAHGGRGKATKNNNLYNKGKKNTKNISNLQIYPNYPRRKSLRSPKIQPARLKTPTLRIPSQFKEGPVDPNIAEQNLSSDVQLIKPDFLEDSGTGTYGNG